MDQRRTDRYYKMKTYIHVNQHKIRSNKKNGTTILMSSHILPDVEEICDSLIVVEKGKLRFSGTQNELINSYSKNDSQLIVKTLNRCPIAQLKTLTYFRIRS